MIIRRSRGGVNYEKSAENLSENGKLVYEVYGIKGTSKPWKILWNVQGDLSEVVKREPVEYYEKYDGKVRVYHDGQEVSERWEKMVSGEESVDEEELERIYQTETGNKADRTIY